MTSQLRESSETGREMRALRSAALQGSTTPVRVLLAPWGQVETTHGTFVVDEESASLAIESFESHGTDVPIDYEHQTLGGAYASPNGQAPAAGWIKGLIADPGVGILAEIEWTEQGRQALHDRSYRYLSPVAVIRKSDRKLVGIHSAALTNKPAIVGAMPIVEGSVSSEGEAVFADLCAELELPPETEAVEILAAAARRLTCLRQAETERRVEERVVRALREGKLTDSQRDWAESLAARDEGLFEEWLRTAPRVVQRGRLTAPMSATEGVGHRGSRAASRARAEYRSQVMLQTLTTEEAYVALALRESEVPVPGKP